MAGGWSTSLAKTPAAGRRRKLLGVGTEGPNGTRDRTHGLEACSPSWDNHQALTVRACWGRATERS